MRKNYFFILSISFSVILTIFSLKETDDLQEILIPFSDKALHILAYIVLTILWSCYAFLIRPNIKPIRNFVILFVGLMLYGMIIEVLQSEITVTRSMEYKDLIANFLGIMIGMLIFNYFIKLKLNNK